MFKSFSILAFLITVVVFSGVGCTKPTETFRVALQSIPDKIDPRENTINIFQYINLHAYYSLFEKSELGELKSEFLDLSSTKSNDSTFTTFRFCVKPGTTFSDASPVTSEDLQSSLVEIHRIKPNLMAIRNSRLEGSCVHVSLASPDEHYFEKLTTQQTTILKKGTERSLIPTGLGPYRVTSLTKERVALEALANRVHGDFKNVEFIKVGTDPSAIKETVHDWNHLYHTPIPAGAKREYREIKRPLLKTYFVLIDLEDKRLREQIALCFNRKEFIRRLDLSLTDAPGYLPRGLPGTNVPYEPAAGRLRKPAAECRFDGLKSKIPYYSYNEYLHSKVTAFFNAANASLPIEIVPKHVTLDETIKDAFADKQMLTLVGADASQPSSDGFFSIFISETKPITKKIAGLKKLVERAAKTADATLKNKLFEKAHRLLLASGYMIPLGQLVTNQYYPKDVQNIRLVDRIQGFPQIDQMEQR